MRIKITLTQDNGNTREYEAELKDGHSLFSDLKSLAYDHWAKEQKEKAEDQGMRFNHEIQCYINHYNNDRVVGCFHPPAMQTRGCCNAHRFCGWLEAKAVAEVRKERALANITRIGMGRPR